MNSTRLPNKALLKIGDKPMLYHVVKQTQAAKYVNEVIIATTTSPKDQRIVEFCKKYNLKFFRGSNSNVLDRYYKCAKEHLCDPVVRISSDCPFIDPDVIDQVILKFLKNSYDYVSNNFKKIHNKWENSTCGYPQGMVVEICNFKTLKKTWNQARKPSEKEHVFPYVQFTPKLFKKTNIVHKKDLSHIRCTVDKKNDLEFVRKVLRKIPKSKKIIHIDDIVKIIQNEPDLVIINNKTSFDEGYKKSIIKDTKFVAKKKDVSK